MKFAQHQQAKARFDKPLRAITDAGRHYRGESDALGRFIGEFCQIRKLGQLKASIFFQRYRHFAEQAGESWIASRDLQHEMQRRGFESKPLTAGNFFLGIELLESTTPHWSDTDGQ